jgi:hypothetical protein
MTFRVAAGLRPRSRCSHSNRRRRLSGAATAWRKSERCRTNRAVICDGDMGWTGRSSSQRRSLPVRLDRNQHSSQENPVAQRGLPPGPDSLLAWLAAHPAPHLPRRDAHCVQVCCRHMPALQRLGAGKLLGVALHHRPAQPRGQRLKQLWRGGGWGKAAPWEGLQRRCPGCPAVCVRPTLPTG